MTRGRWEVAVTASLAIVVTAVVASWMLGRQHTLTNLTFVDVSASTAARAMQDDQFYSEYGDKVLVVQGTVASVQGTPGGRQVALRTDGEFGLTCTLTGQVAGPQPSVGAVVSLVAIGGTAQREPSSVNLPDCRMGSGR